MLFNSYEFIFVFLPIVIIGFIGCQKTNNKTIATSWLIVCSLFFYGWWNPNYLQLILLSICVNFFLATTIRNFSALKKTRFAKTTLLIGISLNLLLLAYFKYANFFIENINLLLNNNHSTLDIVLPLAISFFTFQQITYLVDTHKGEVASHSLLDYCLFVTFFPQLIAGPIVHHKEMMPQFSGSKFLETDALNISKGLSLFSLGLFKKVVIADYFALLANPVFEQNTVVEMTSFTSAWIGSIGYTLQLYFDFSGYSDMALGLALMFGITLPCNFNSPYKANCIIEFWRRWHMTLSRFLKDYVYIPLGGNQKGDCRRFINILLTMFLGGLWHGAGWTFVIWGLLHGTYLIINHAWRVLPKLTFTTFNSFSTIFWKPLTFIAVVVAWVFFRSENLSSAMQIISSMFSPDMTVDNNDLADFIPLSIGLLLVWYAPNSNEIFSIKKNHSTIAYRWSISIPSAILFSVMGFITVIYLARAQEFLYFQF